MGQKHLSIDTRCGERSTFSAVLVKENSNENSLMQDGLRYHLIKLTLLGGEYSTILNEGI